MWTGVESVGLRQQNRSIKMRVALAFVLLLSSSLVVAQEGQWILIDSQGSLSGNSRQRKVFVFSPVDRYGNTVRFWVKHESVSLSDFVTFPNQRAPTGPVETTKYMEADCDVRTLAEFINAHMKGPAEFVPPGSVAAKMLATVCGAK
jgi:hypothetical protein